jgi:hypothetical protein
MYNLIKSAPFGVVSSADASGWLSEQTKELQRSNAKRNFHFAAMFDENKPHVVFCGKWHGIAQSIWIFMVIFFWFCDARSEMKKKVFYFRNFSPKKR